MSRQGQLKILNHPLIQHKLTLMRCTDTPSNSFRRLLKEISILMSYEVFRDLPLKNIITNTPIQSMRSPVLSEKTVCLVPILRAGNGMLDGFIEIVSGALVGHIGLYRDEETLKAHDYYINLPKGIGDAKTIILDLLGPPEASGRVLGGPYLYFLGARSPIPEKPLPTTSETKMFVIFELFVLS